MRRRRSNGFGCTEIFEIQKNKRKASTSSPSKNVNGITVLLEPRFQKNLCIFMVTIELYTRYWRGRFEDTKVILTQENNIVANHLAKSNLSLNCNFNRYFIISLYN
ncbi:unnamed protein product [Thlaspi arvense]|uniref:Uncharacterized protein n=1 Tax=Thlaspi arvense TaxID=13288 RepID=A0AAU9SKJ1_THLAR|nr:unnamed protein product [Thlaspi arvense]